jgi:hypothetical protein
VCTLVLLECASLIRHDVSFIKTIRNYIPNISASESSFETAYKLWKEIEDIPR